MANPRKKAKNPSDKKRKSKKKDQEVSFHRKPEGMTVERWQIALRSQFVKENNFVIENIGAETVFSDFSVRNPESKKTYKVAIRSANADENYCDCYDYKVSQLGTCKHIEAVFHQIRKKKQRKYLKEPIIRAYSSVYVDYSEGRKI